MTTENTEPTKTRTDWDARLAAACAAYEKRGKVVTATTMKYPPNPALVVRIGDALPYTFATVKAAALKLEGFLEAPL